MPQLNQTENTVSAYQAATHARGAMAGAFFSETLHTLARWLRGKR